MSWYEVRILALLGVLDLKMPLNDHMMLSVLLWVFSLDLKDIKDFKNADVFNLNLYTLLKSDDAQIRILESSLKFWGIRSRF